MDLFGENPADGVDEAQHGDQGYACFLFPPKLQALAAIQKYGYLARPVPVRGIILCFSHSHLRSKDGFIFYAFLFVSSYFPSPTPSAVSSTVSLSPFPTCCKLTFATWRLNLAVLARIGLLIIFERCLQELKSFHLSQHGIGNVTSCVLNQMTAFTSNHHRSKE